jgi:hypothetical protein
MRKLRIEILAHFSLEKLLGIMEPRTDGPFGAAHDFGDFGVA